MKRFQVLFLSCLTLCFGQLFSQANIQLSNPLADQVIRGNYNPADYAATVVIDGADTLAQEIQNRVSPDSLKAYLTVLSRFGNRNTGADTVSNTFGIGAARRWGLHKFQQFSEANEDRLLVGYLQFDQVVCNVGQHRNVVGVLPGANPSGAGFVLIEGHMDSRCESLCDSLCIAQGSDDNGSGTVLVMELARVMSQYTFDETIVFMLTTGEEQGLIGAEALATYCDNENIPVKAVLNNDVIGGIYCGNTASPPGCPGAGDVDSLNVRIYSYGGYNSAWKQLARYNKLQYQEMLEPLVQVPMNINIMTGEDRVGRGGDHIPFRMINEPSCRFTSANEHGNGAPGSGYTDRQHSTRDSIGLDLDNDGELDTFFVDFNYLARNARINGVAAAMISTGPPTPVSFTPTAVPGGIRVELPVTLNHPAYRVAIRTLSNDWDTVYTITNLVDTVSGLNPGVTILSVAAVDAEGVESLFSFERNVNIPLANGEPGPANGLQLLPNRPNPFDEQTIIAVQMDAPMAFEEAYILITDANGREVERIPMALESDINEVRFVHGFHAAGVYHYSLVVDGEILQSRRMVMR